MAWTTSSPRPRCETQRREQKKSANQATDGRSMNLSFSISLSLFLLASGGAPRSVPPGNAPHLSISLSLVFRVPNSLEAVVLLVQTSPAAPVDEHVQKNHRFLSVSLSRPRQARSSSPSRGRSRPVPPCFHWGLCTVFQPKMRRCWRKCESGVGRAVDDVLASFIQQKRI